MQEIKITITKADERLSSKITDTADSTVTGSFKYTYLKQLITRVRVTKGLILDKPVDEQERIMRDVLRAEREITHFAAERYAELNNEELFNALMSIGTEIEELLDC